jgi:hypothetical protein
LRSSILSWEGQVWSLEGQVLGSGLGPWRVRSCVQAFWGLGTRSWVPGGAIPRSRSPDANGVVQTACDNYTPGSDAFVAIKRRADLLICDIQIPAARISFLRAARGWRPGIKIDPASIRLRVGVDLDLTIEHAPRSTHRRGIGAPSRGQGNIAQRYG